MIEAEIITIGDEILIGQILDTNSQWIAQQLDQIGIKVIRATSITDHKTAIIEALDYGVSNFDLLIFTGGLGPTKDDITKHTFCEYFGTELVKDNQHYAQLKKFFESRGRKMNALNESQALIPSNCELIPNPVGTAPGMWFKHKETIIISMPGVPHEMKNIMTESALPRLSAELKTEAVIHRTVQTIGIGESDMALILEDWENELPEFLKLAYLPNLGRVRLRLTGRHPNESFIKKEIDSRINTLKHLLEPYVFGENEDTIESTIGKLLLKNQATVSTAESCTGGYLAHQITKTPGSSKYFKGSIIAYSNEIKINELGVPKEIIDQNGAVSEEVVRKMAESIRKKYNTTYGLSCSGIAGPDGGTEEKPVGTVWMALASKSETITLCKKFPKGRLENIHLTAIYLLDMLRQRLSLES